MSLKSEKAISEYLGPNDAEKQLAVDDPLVAQKLDFIIDGIGCLLSKATIIKGFQEKFDVCRATAYNWYAYAKDEMIRELDKPRQEHIAESIASMKAVAKRALVKGDHAAAVSALKYKDSVVALTEQFNKVETQPNGSNASQIEEIDSQSARDLAKLIADSKATTGTDKSSPVGSEQRPED